MGTANPKSQPRKALIGYVLILDLISIAVIVILAYIVVVPQAKRQEKRNIGFRKNEVSDSIKKNHHRLKQEYEKFVANGFPNTREQDRPLLTEQYFMALDARNALENMIGGGDLRYPRIRLMDVRCVVIASALQAVVILLQTFLP